MKVTFSPGNRGAVGGLHSLDDDYCTLIQDKLHLRYRCLQQDRMICQQSKDDGQRLVYTCHGGLTEAVIPIEIAGSLVCYALIGQFRTSETLEPSIVRSWLQSGFELAILEEAFLKRPLYDTPMLEKMFELFKVSIGLLIETESLRVRQPDLIEKVLMYLDTNIGESITLADVSKAVHRSPSSITHTLQAKMGCSFQQLLINKRLLPSTLRSCAIPFANTGGCQEGRIPGPSLFFAAVQEEQGTDPK